ncbi:UxaA family hydrolase [Bordetella tumulicola]|uniref:UxaA family hydrolase n=1 Tax=Bordetella tumulicola TaxID=1649133 RepID=UPI0039EE9B4B
MPRPTPIILLHPDDDVAIARHQLVAGMELPAADLRVAGLVPPGHKIAVRPLPQGSSVKRYNQVIGVATRNIAAGQHVHVHNLAMTGHGHAAMPAHPPAPIVPYAQPAQFMGIVRSDGRVATRNYIGVLTSVNCSATVARAIADRFRREIYPDELAPFSNVDGVVALTHAQGCAVDAEGDGLAVLRRTLAGYARQANFAAVLIVGLGCETNQIAGLMADYDLAEGPALHTYTIQQMGGTAKAVDTGIARVRQLLPGANQATRELVSASHLVVGLQCGGSDGYSGITANPALGMAVDTLVRHGGAAILSETPEIYGAEHLLTQRAASPEVAGKLLERIAWWEAHCARYGANLNNNPSAGNKAGGLTTILEKSLGAVAKGGTVPLMQVYQYAESVTAKGLVFMDTPGYDPVSATGQVAGGANLICFTTGRGSAYGCAPVPSLKLSTNTDLWRRQQDDIDFNCGEVLDGTMTLAQAGAHIFQAMLDTASGRKTRSEQHGYGQNEFVPWQLGVTT